MAKAILAWPYLSLSAISIKSLMILKLAFGLTKSYNVSNSIYQIKSTEFVPLGLNQIYSAKPSKQNLADHNQCILIFKTALDLIC